MTANPPTASRNNPEAPLRAFDAKYPAPDVKEWIADRQWLDEQRAKGAFDAHDGKVIAVYNKEVVGVGDNYVTMMLELGPKYGVHPERIVCVYHGDEFYEPGAAAIPFAPAGDVEAPLRELAAKYPDFDWREAAADRFWLAEQQMSGALDTFWGKVVAVYKKEVVGVGDNYVEMLLKLSSEYDVHSGRIVVVYLGE